MKRNTQQTAFYALVTFIVALALVIIFCQPKDNLKPFKSILKHKVDGGYWNIKKEYKIDSTFVVYPSSLKHSN